MCCVCAFDVWKIASFYLFVVCAFGSVEKRLSKTSLLLLLLLLCRSDGDRLSWKPTDLMKRSRLSFFKNARWQAVLVLAKRVWAFGRASMNRIGDKRLMHALSRDWSLEENDDESKLQEKQDEQKTGVMGYTKILKQSLLPAF